MSFLTPASDNQAYAAAGINHQINFQGKLVNPDGTNVTDGSYSIVFSIYNVSSGGSAIWTETQTVTVTSGIFQVNLGSVTSLPGSIDFNTNNIYLGIKVGADAEMTPRIQFTAVPQAFDSEKLNGLASSQFARADANNLLTGTQDIQNTSTSAFVLQQASAGAVLFQADTSNQVVGIGAAPTAGGAKLQVNGTVSLSLSGTTGGTLVCQNASNVLASCTNSYATGSGAAFVQGGNSFGTTATLGTTDANPLTIGTWNGAALQQRINVTNTTAAGNNATITFNGAELFKPTADSTTAFQVQPAGSSNAVFNVDTSASTVTVRGGAAASLGSELMTSTTNFTSGWSGAGWTFSATNAVHAAGSTTPAVYSGFTPINGAAYQVTFTFSGASGNGTDSITAQIGGNSAGAIYAASDTNETALITTSSTGSLQFIPSSSWNGTITSVSVKLASLSAAALKVLNSSGSTAVDVRTAGAGSSTYVGLGDGQNDVSGIGNTAFGSASLISNISGNDNTAVGTFSLHNSTTGGGNTAVGWETLFNNTTGASNIAIGTQALFTNTTGSNEVAIGAGSLQNNIIGTGNTAVGYNTLNANTTGSNNTAIGSSNLQGNTTGSNNVALGGDVLAGNTTGASNVAIGGFWTLVNNTTGSGNTGLGTIALTTNTTGSNNLGLGNGTDVLFNNLSQAGAIGANTKVGTSNTIVLGRTGGSDSVVVGSSYSTGNEFSAAAQTYTTGTIAQAGTAITGTGTTWTQGMNGGTIIYSDGTTATVTYVSTSSLTSSISKTVTAGASYSIVWGGLNVSNNAAFELQNTANSTTAFQIQNASAASILSVDTATTSNLITNGDFENGDGVSGWSKKGSATNPVATTSQQWQGNQSLSETTTALAGDGVKYSYPNTLLTSGQTYTLQFYMKLSSGTWTNANVKIGFSNDGSTDSFCTELGGATPSTTTWQWFGCQFTAGAQSGSPYIFIQQNDAVARTFYIDGVILSSGTGFPSFNPGGTIQLNGIVNSPVIFGNKSDSNNAFTIQNAAQTIALLDADTIDGFIGIGTPNPKSPLYVAALAPDTSSNANVTTVAGTLSSTTHSQSGIGAAPAISPGAASSQLYAGVSTVPVSNDSTHLAGASIAGIYGGPYYYGTGTLGNAYGGYFQVQNGSTGTISTAEGLYVQNPTASGTYTKDVGIAIDDLTRGTNHTNLLITSNASTAANIPAANYSIYDNSTLTNYFAGLLQGALGMTITGATSNINASSNFATNINSGTSTGAVTIGNTSGGFIAMESAHTINMTIGASSTFNAHTNATASGTGYGYTIQAGNESGTTSTGGSISVDAGTGTSSNGSINIGTTNALTTTIGNATGADNVLVQGGTGSSVQLQSQGSILIGNNAVAQTITVGNSAGASAVNITSGTANITLTSNGATAGTVIMSGTNSTNAFQVQNSSGYSVLGVDTSAGQALFGTNGHVGGQLVVNGSTSGGITLNVAAATASYTITLPSAAPTAANQCLQSSGTTPFSQLAWGTCGSGGGGGGHAKKIILTAEYAGAVMDNNGAGNDIGTMSAGFDSTQRESYYQWTTGQSINQTYSVLVQIPVPSDFSSWASTTPITVDVKTSDTTNGTVTGNLIDTAGTTETSWNTCALTPATTSWTTKTGCTVSGTYSANGMMTLRLILQSPTNGTTQVGNVTLNYNSAY